jgi:hypothetical protein
MAERTGLDVLIELLEQVKTLSKKVDVLDQNVKVLLNQGRTQKPAVQEFVPPPQKQELPKQEPPKQDPPASGTRFKFESSKPGARVNGKVVILNGDVQTPIPEAIVKIYDANDVLVRETKSNRAGSWLLKLAPGQYIAEIKGQFKGKDLVPQNKQFTVEPGMTELEVI